MDPHQILKYPLSTEKSIRIMEEENKLVFEAELDSSKDEIKEAVEELFDVNVEDVNTMITPQAEKKAYVKFGPETPAIEIATDLGLM